jgi:hypothetical protein
VRAAWLENTGPQPDNAPLLRQINGRENSVKSDLTGLIWQQKYHRTERQTNGSSCTNDFSTKQAPTGLNFVPRSRSASQIC